MVSAGRWAIPMADPAHRLLAVQWLAASFPVGGFAYSQGLEQAIAAGEVASPAAVERWCEDVLLLGSARSDAIFVCLARAGDMALADLNALALAFAGSAERRAELADQGAAFAAAVARAGGPVLPPLAYPVAVGAAVRGLDLPAPEIAALFLQAVMAQLLQAAVRFLPLGQSDAQAIQARLAPAIVATAAGCAVAGPDDMGSACPRADFLQMRHETLAVRIFRS